MVFTGILMDLEEYSESQEYSDFEENSDSEDGLEEHSNSKNGSQGHSDSEDGFEDHSGSEKRSGSKDMEVDEAVAKGSSKKRKVKRAAKCVKLKKLKKGEYQGVVYNESGQPIGQGGTDISSYGGYLVRARVRITITNWKYASPTLKKNLWISLKEKFKLDTNKRSICTSAMGRLWKAFKSHLTRRYILPFKNKLKRLKKIPKLYRKVISQEDWDTFVKSRLTPEFLDDYQTQVKEGTLEVEGTKDVLTMALGTPEHGGRVRGVGDGVTPTQYFCLIKRGSKKHVRPLDFKAREEEEKRKKEKQKRKKAEEKGKEERKKRKELKNKYKELEEKFNDRLTSPASEKISSNSHKSDNRDHIPPLCGAHSKRKNKEEKSRLSETNSEPDFRKVHAKGTSHSPLPNPMLPIGKGRSCSLAVDFKSNVVAKGIVYEELGPETKLHNVPLGQYNSHVAVGKILEGKEQALLPHGVVPYQKTGNVRIAYLTLSSGIEKDKGHTKQDNYSLPKVFPSHESREDHITFSAGTFRNFFRFRGMLSLEGT
ncbi:hypothetical protein IFM89_025493 [Coptis chinensis]|uniref:Transposase n=1 Tax=Coptis chinensis TaxID=261450 RepID=A0A835I3F4_9MAGN|nr:hypothetical protein IFM89_025493 [Coptis chinensis]